MSFHSIFGKAKKQMFVYHDPLSCSVLGFANRQH